VLESVCACVSYKCYIALKMLYSIFSLVMAKQNKLDYF